MTCLICNERCHSLKTHFLKNHCTEENLNDFLYNYVVKYYFNNEVPTCPICGKPLKFIANFSRIERCFQQTCGDQSCIHKLASKNSKDKWEKEHPGESYDEYISNKRKKGAQTLAKKLQEQYGENITNVSQLQSTKDKVKQTNIEKYGDWYGKTEQYRDQVKKNALEKYGVDSINKTEEKIEKYKQTCIERYGSDNWFGNKENREKVLKTLQEKYGVENVSQIPEVQNKISISKKNNNTFNSSFLEDFLYKSLVEIYGEHDIIRQYQSKKYSNFYTGRLFNCDFYIKSLDLYIELQGSTAHGLAPYVSEENSKQSLEYISKDKRFGYEYYLNTDVLKRSSAKRNNLNYIELFFNKTEYYTKEKIQTYINEYLINNKSIFTYDDIEINEKEILYL